MNTLKSKLNTYLLTLPVVGLMMTPTALAQNPYADRYDDESWISISGEVDKIHDDAFTLKYTTDKNERHARKNENRRDAKANSIRVEMDDWDWYDESDQLRKGQKVTVYGVIDDDLYEKRTIEASSVYVENFGTYFYASSADEEDRDENREYGGYWLDYSPVDVGRTRIRGTVTKVDGREFTIDNGRRKLIVDTDEMRYNPMDDEGYQRIDKGDYIVVSGHMDEDFWEARELKADHIISLEDDLARRRNSDADRQADSRR